MAVRDQTGFDSCIASPQKTIPGNLMSFSGIPVAKHRILEDTQIGLEQMRLPWPIIEVSCLYPSAIERSLCFHASIETAGIRAETFPRSA
jgi:hypothetical protein